MPEPAATLPRHATPRADSDRPSPVILRVIAGGFFVAGAVWAAGACVFVLSTIGDWRVPGLAIPVFIPYPRIELGVWRVAVRGVTGIPLLLTNLSAASACALVGVRLVRRKSHAWWQALVLAWAGSF